MRLVIAAIGRLGAGYEARVVQDYSDRIQGLAAATRLGPMELRELEDKRRRGPQAEAALLAGVAAERRVALDERGRSLDSKGFAAQLMRWRDDGVGATAFLIGGADGHATETRRTADLVLSFGALTWPHGLARVMLAEQLYRAAAIAAGHPYHREG